MNLFIYQDCQKSNQDLAHRWKLRGNGRKRKPLLVQLLHYLLPAPFLFHIMRFLIKIFPSFLELGSTFSSKAVISALTCTTEGFQVYWQSRENVYVKKCRILNSTFFFFTEQISRWMSSFQIITTISSECNSSVIPPSLHINSVLAFILRCDLTERC